jgi:hypothetical protein
MNVTHKHVTYKDGSQHDGMHAGRSVETLLLLNIHASGIIMIRSCGFDEENY